MSKRLDPRFFAMRAGDNFLPYPPGFFLDTSLSARAKTAYCLVAAFIAIGDGVPTVSILAARLNVSETVMHRCLAELVRERLIERELRADNCQGSLPSRYYLLEHPLLKVTLDEAFAAKGASVCR